MTGHGAAGRPDLCIPAARWYTRGRVERRYRTVHAGHVRQPSEGRDRRPLLELRKADLPRLHGAGAGRDQVPRLRAHAALGPGHAAAAEGGQGGRRRVRGRLGVRRAARLRRRGAASGSSRSSSRTSSGCSPAAPPFAPPGTTAPRRRPGSPRPERDGRTSAPGSSSPPSVGGDARALRPGASGSSWPGSSRTGRRRERRAARKRRRGAMRTFVVGSVIGAAAAVVAAPRLRRGRRPDGRRAGRRPRGVRGRALLALRPRAGPRRREPMTRVAALYDIHANLPALDAVLAEAGDADLARGRAATSRAGRCRPRPSTGCAASASASGSSAGTPTAIGRRRGRMGDGAASASERLDVPGRAARDGDDRDRRARAASSSATDRRAATRTSSPPSRPTIGWSGSSRASPSPSSSAGTPTTSSTALAHGVRVVNAGSVGMPYEGRPGAFWAMLGPDVEPALDRLRPRRRGGRDPRDAASRTPTSSSTRCEARRPRTRWRAHFESLATG